MALVLPSLSTRQTHRRGNPQLFVSQRRSPAISYRGPVTWYQTDASGNFNISQYLTVTVPANLVATGTVGLGASAGVRATVAAPTSKFIFELTINALAGGSPDNVCVGIDGATVNLGATTSLPGNFFGYNSGGGIFENGAFTQSATAAVNGQIVTVAGDPPNGTLKLFLNGVQQGATVTGVNLATWHAYASATQADNFTANFAGPFAYPQSGYSAYDPGTGATAITATASPTLSAFTSSSAAKVLVKATGSAALSNFATSSAAKVLVKATASASLNSFTSAAADKILIKGAGSGILSAFTSSSAAKVLVKGLAAPSPSSFTTTSAAKVIVKAAAASSINTLVSASAAKALVHGLGSGTLNAFTASSAVTVKVKITGAPTPAAFDSSAVAQVKVKATGSPALDPFTCSATADVIAPTITAQASITLSPFISAAAAKALVEGQGSGTLSAFTSSASANVRIRASASITLGQMRLTAELRLIVIHPAVDTPADRAIIGEREARDAAGTGQPRSTSGPPPDNRTASGSIADRTAVGNLQLRRSAA